MSSSRPKSQPVQTAPVTYTSQSGGGTSSQTQTFAPWARARPAYGRMADRTNALATQGPQYVGPSGYTQQAWNSGAQGAQGMANLLPTAQGNYNFLSNAADVANNPYVQGMLQTNNQQAMDALTRQMLPALQSGAVGVNNLGSSRLALAQGQAIGDTQRSLQQANNQLMMGAYGQGLGAQQNALGQTGALQQSYLAPSQAYQGIGQSQEAYDQARIDAPWRHLQNVGAALQYTNPMGVMSGRGTGTQYGGTGPAGSQNNGAPVAAQDPNAQYGAYNPNPNQVPAGAYPQAPAPVPPGGYLANVFNPWANSYS